MKNDIVVKRKTGSRFAFSFAVIVITSLLSVCFSARLLGNKYLFCESVSLSKGAEIVMFVIWLCLLFVTARFIYCLWGEETVVNGSAVASNWKTDQFAGIGFLASNIGGVLTSFFLGSFGFKIVPVSEDPFSLNSLGSWTLIGVILINFFWLVLYPRYKTSQMEKFLAERSKRK